MTRRLVLCVLVALGACSEATEPAVPRTREEALKRLDAAISQLSWAQRDLWALGGRDMVVWVQIDSSQPPHYFRLPRKAP